MSSVDNSRKITDWYIPEAEDKPVVAYPGGWILTGDERAQVEEIRRAILWRLSQDKNCTDDFRLSVGAPGADPVLVRVHVQRNIDGVIYICRRSRGEAPSIGDIGLPKDIERLLMGERFGEGGGLVVISGANGTGKSTTCASVVADRVKKHASFCLTVEHPVEFMLEGNYPVEGRGLGKIIQVQVDDGDFQSAIRSASRCYPSNMRGSMLMIGEVRDGATAAELLKASANGLLVLATTHGFDAASTLERIISLAEGCLGAKESRSIMAHSLRCVLHQNLERGKLQVSPLFATQSSKPLIRAGELHRLSTDIEIQRTHMEKGSLFDYVMKGQ